MPQPEEFFEEEEILEDEETINEEEVDEFDNSALSVIREALERGEDQPFTERERVTFRLVLASECRFLRGLDIAWVQPATGDAPSASPMIPGALPVAQ